MNIDLIVQRATQAINKKVVVGLIMTILISGCSSSHDSNAKSPNPTLSNGSKTASATPKAPTEVTVEISVPDSSQGCSLVDDPKKDLLGQTIVRCDLEMKIQNRSQTEFEYSCNAWFTLSNGLRYYENPGHCAGSLIVNPGNSAVLDLKADLPQNEIVTQIEIGNSHGSTKFTNVDFKIPSNCKYDTDWESTFCD